MSVATHSSEEGRVESEARDGSDSSVICIDAVSEKFSDAIPRSVTEEDLLRKTDDEVGDALSDTSNQTLKPDTLSDLDRGIQPILTKWVWKSNSTHS